MNIIAKFRIMLHLALDRKKNLMSSYQYIPSVKEIHTHIQPLKLQRLLDLASS